MQQPFPEDWRELNDAARLVPCTRDALDLIRRVEEAAFSELLKSVEGHHLGSNYTEVVFANDGNSEDTRFRLEAVFNRLGAGETYIRHARRTNNKLSMRIMVFDEDKFVSYTEYPSIDSLGRES